MVGKNKICPFKRKILNVIKTSKYSTYHRYKVNRIAQEMQDNMIKREEKIQHAESRNQVPLTTSPLTPSIPNFTGMKPCGDHGWTLTYKTDTNLPSLCNECSENEAFLFQGPPVSTPDIPSDGPEGMPVSDHGTDSGAEVRAMLRHFWKVHENLFPEIPGGVLSQGTNGCEMEQSEYLTTPVWKSAL